MADLAERYLREHVAVRCKPATVYGYGRIVRKNVLPALGKLPLAAVGGDGPGRFRRTRPRAVAVPVGQAVRSRADGPHGEA